MRAVFQRLHRLLIRKVDVQDRGAAAALGALRAPNSTGAMPRAHAFPTYIVVFLSSIAISGAGAIVFGIPIPRIHDEFSYLFAGQTFAKFRLANPAPPVPEAFYAPYLLVEPSFAAMFPPAQGLFLAVGTLLGLPIAGVWISGGIAAICLHWSARAALPGLLAGVPTALFMVSVLFSSRWIASYWGGLVAFAGGALVIGFFMRLHKRFPSTLAFGLFGLGLSVLALSRPFEGLVLAAVLALVYIDRLLGLIRSARPPTLLRRMTVTGVILAGGLGLQGAFNAAVTGHPLRMPHQEFRRQYMSVPLFRWQLPTVPEKYDARLADVENAYRETKARLQSQDSWPEHVVFTFRAAIFAMYDVGGYVTLLLFAGGAVYALMLWPRLLLALLAFPVLQSIATYTHLSHYFAPAAPLWFIIPGIAIGFLAKRFRAPYHWVILMVVIVAVPSVWFHSLRHTLGSRSSYHRELLSHLNGSEAALAFVRYHPALAADISVVYNGPDLNDQVLLANDLGEERNCEVVRWFRDRRVFTVLVSPDSLAVEPSDLRERCDERIDA